MQFDMPKEQSSIIKVIGVGGGGCNAVNTMFQQGIKGVNFVICNTDAQALDMSPVPNKIQLGPDLTEGRGAGSNPEVGKKATEESMDEIKELLQKNTKMVFVTAGMGGGTGTGGAPVIARIAKEMGILVVGIVTIPFNFEGRRRKQQAENGINALKEHVDTILVVSNDKLREIYGNLALSKAFNNADDILTTAAKGIAEIITVPGYVNVDFEDVKTVMVDSGVAIMGSAVAEGEDRALRSVSGALSSPLLAENDIRGANYILLNITSGNKEVLMDEITEITDYVQEAAGNEADIIWGNCYDDSLGDKLMVTIIATGFKGGNRSDNSNKHKKVVIPLDEKKPEEPVETFHQPEENYIPEFDEPRLKEPEDENTEKEEHRRDQYSFEFNFGNESKNTQEPQEEEQVDDGIRSYIKEDMPKNEAPAPQEQKPVNSNNRPPEPPPSSEVDEERLEMQRRHNERIKRLRNLSMKLNNESNITDLEKEPAYKRRNIALENVPHSSEPNLSRYTLSDSEDEGDDRPNLRKGNSFLHDNVD